jgi:hypothetical protein
MRCCDVKIKKKKLCRDVIENRPLTKEIPTSGKEVRDDSIVVLAINNLPVQLQLAEVRERSGDKARFFSLSDKLETRYNSCSYYSIDIA